MFFGVALWTAESFWPSSILKGCFALLFNAILGEELIQAHAFLKLDLVHLHGWPPCCSYRKDTL
jgi:hypothetical protein